MNFPCKKHHILSFFTMKKSSIYFILLPVCLFSFECKRLPLCVLSFGVHYNSDNAELRVNNTIIWTENITTNYSMGRAKMNVKVFASKQSVVNVKVNNTSKNLTFKNKGNLLLVNFVNNELEIKDTFSPGM